MITVWLILHYLYFVSDFTMCSTRYVVAQVLLHILPWNYILYNHIRRIEVQLATQWPILTIFVQKLSGLFSFETRDIVLGQTHDFSWLKKCWIKAGELILKALKQSIVEVLKYFNAKRLEFSIQYLLIFVLSFQYGRLLNRVVKL